LFFGHQTTRVDEKGRLKLSSDYKSLIDEKLGPKFYITTLDVKRAQIYPLQEWLNKLAELQAMPTTSSIRQRIFDITSRYGQQVDMDSAGRLLIPQELREDAKLTGEVMVLSKGNILELANAAEFRETAQPLSAEEMAAAAALGW
jgi:MraZ protein